MSNPEHLPPEIEEWLKSLDSHREAATRVAEFWLTFRRITRDTEAATQMTQSWMMVCYGFPKGMPFNTPREDEG